jgi:hypothetical protein
VDLTTRGRKRGFCAVWATQRLAEVSKSATSMLQNRLVGGTFEDVDIKRALDLLSVSPEHKHEVAQQLKVLEPGTFYAFGRAISKERLLFKVGEVKTSHPKPGSSKHAAEPPAPSAKVRELLTKLAELPQIAEEKARTLADYKAQIRELRNEVSALRKAKPAEASSGGDAHKLRSQLSALVKKNSALKASAEELMKIVAKVNALGFEGLAIKPEELKAIFEEAAKQIGKLADKKIQLRNTEIDALKKDMAKVQRRLSALLTEEEETIDVSVDLQRQEPFKLRESPSARPSPSGNGNSLPQIEGLNSSQVKILNAIAEFESLGRTSIDKRWIAALIGVSHTSGGFGNNLGGLRSAGFIDYPQPGIIAFTSEGRSVAPHVDAPTSAEEMLQRCKHVVNASQSSILDVLAEAYPKPLEKAAIAEKIGVSPTSGGFGNNLGGLRSAGMIDYPRQGEAKISSWVMLEE